MTAPTSAIAPTPHDPRTVTADDFTWLIRGRSWCGLIAERAAVTPDTRFLIDPHGTELTFGEFAQRVERVAAALAAEGIGPGAVVAWQLPTRISTLLVMSALRRLDAIQAPIIHLYREREVRASLEAVEPTHFIVPGVWGGFDFTAMARSIADADGPSPTLLEVGVDAPETADTSSLPPVPSTDDDGQQFRWVYFTSGSSGVPKGARHTDATILTGSTGFAGLGRMGTRPGEVSAMAFPVAHIGGAIYQITCLAAGFPMLVLEAFDPARIVTQFREHKVTSTGGAPALYAGLMAMQKASPEPLFPDLTLLKGGGAPCPPEYLDEGLDVLGVVIAHDYGMTEVPMIAAADPYTDSAVLRLTDGIVVPGNEVRLVDLDDVPVAEGVDGLVQVRGGGVCKGYTDPTKNAENFTDDGWFRTGDLGRIHPSGHIEVIGRIKEMIIRKGEKIAPLEIEDLLSRHPRVTEVAVIGLPDAERGERVCAVVVPTPGGNAPTLAELTAYLSAQGLMKQKLPEQLEVLPELPRTGLSKVAKATLRSQFSELSTTNNEGEHA
ncbi:putative cyclohex-1-ene-1-carboxylate:CoA ligase [Janibacter sp. HTCC2649]|uniref:class I adenylate-forming enzyme family protein n=1 Tax=Janibacter sp. HTCC2649 TaxID=313589 RepID=UPI0000670D4B|nr:AMP-binding protein [Janibacter sp. HTCC2649]EAQ00618.1 putative cyclohex-1-ene-1-carboxylate:CoA ligase [Janibacter sp. HTCC2649]